MSQNVPETPALSSRSSIDDIRHRASGTQTPRSRASARIGRHKSSYIMESLPPPSPSWTPVPSIHGGPTSGATTARTSRRNSFTSMHSMASHGGIMEDIKHEAMVNFLFQQQCKKLWISSGSGALEGVLVRKSRGNYAACPPALCDSALGYYSSLMNLPVVMTINSRVIQAFVHLTPDATNVPLGKGLHIQILPSVDDLPKGRKNQGAAFLAAEQLLLVWDDDPNVIFARAVHIEDELMKLVWRAGEPDEIEEPSNEKKGPAVVETEIDEETGDFKPEDRRTNIIHGVLVGFTMCLITVMLGLGFKEIAVQIMIDGNYIRIALLLMTPILFFFALFFTQTIVGCVAQMIGPVRQMKSNSKYYSALLPRRITGKLPHITVQCPVYKEGLASVIAPTVKSLKAAMATYELQGGSANIFVNDDGLQLIDEEERQARIEFYQDNSIGWTARPKHGDDGFVRKGKFKKASNMNFGLMISNNVEEKLALVQRDQNWTQDDEAKEYDRCLKEVIEEHGRAWADGNIRIGDYIILIDSDTRVPVDCFLDAASEMEQSPEVGIMQFSSGVMQVVHNFFENGITFFTNLIYTAIRYGVSNGDVAPFVGHNAILRWSAIQQVSFFDEDGYEKYWSESHVSEDFDMSLRLQINGYIIRLAAWAGEGFKEGVSLTVYDELARWEKYAYGCNELLFHPMRYWITRGPFTPLFRSFVCSNIHFASKLTIISYIGTYYAIGAAWIMTLANYFAVGWFNGHLDHYYLESWKVWLSVVVVFNGVGNLALAVMRYRVGDKGFLASFWENMKWTLMMSIFFGGLSMHVSSALLAHMFGYNMQWGATSKEAEFSNFFIEVPKVLKSFKYSMAFSIVIIAGMIILAVGPFIPYDWQINTFIAILPMSIVCGSHLLLPIVLNPALMTFTF